VRPGPGVDRKLAGLFGYDILRGKWSDVVTTRRLPFSQLAVTLGTGANGRLQQGSITMFSEDVWIEGLIMLTRNHNIHTIAIIWLKINSTTVTSRRNNLTEPKKKTFTRFEPFIDSNRAYHTHHQTTTYDQS
jgi:hypothetical protein